MGVGFSTLKSKPSSELAATSSSPWSFLSSPLSLLQPFYLCLLRLVPVDIDIRLDPLDLGLDFELCTRRLTRATQTISWAGEPHLDLPDMAIETQLNLWRLTRATLTMTMTIRRRL